MAQWTEAVPMEQRCDEGGVHDFRPPAQGHGACWKCCCCPFFVCFSCAMSAGTAGASHVGMHGGDDRPDEPTCTKCGLNPSEASALAQAKEAEAHGLRTSKGANYFRNAGMSLNLTAGVDTSAAPSPSPHPAPSSGHSRTPSQTPTPYPPGSPTPTVHARGPPESEAATTGAAGRPEDPRVGQWLANLPPAGH